MIHIENVSYIYDGSDKKSLNSVNLDIKDGEFVLLCGMSGCGKTTLTKIVNGILLNLYAGMFGGKVIVNGMDIENSSLNDICKVVGSVFQNPRTQFYTLNTTDEIAFGCENLGLPREEIKRRVEQTIECFHMEKLANRNIFGLSGGEKQKIALASIYAMNPDIYVLDEPSANLDAHAVEELRKILKMLKQQGKTILISEHRIHYLRDLIDRAVYMKDGEIVREYSSKELDSMTLSERIDTGIRPVSLKSFQAERKPCVWGNDSIVMNNVSVSYGRHKALDIGNIRLLNGGVISLVGDNGAGKSTFVSVLSGLIKKSGGSFFINSLPVKSTKRIKQSFMILQEVNHQLFTNSVRNEITLGCNNFSEESLDEVMQYMNISELQNRHPSTLSGGQKQRVVIASAFFCKKKILIFDEPTSGLDFHHMTKTVNLLLDLKKNDYFIILITHDYELLMSVCDRVIMLDKGKIVDDYELNDSNAAKLKDFLLTEKV